MLVLRSVALFLLASVTVAQPLRFAIEDGSYELRIGGRLSGDLLLPHADDALQREFGEIDEDGELRRARLHFRGRLGERIGFRVQAEFADEQVEFRSAYLSLHDVPLLGTVYVGSFREPFGLERQTGTRDTLFLERALPAAISPGRNTGIGSSRAFAEERGTAHLGLFVDPDDDRDLGSNDDAVSITGRVTYLPWSEDGGRELLHVGGSLSHRWIGEPGVSFSRRPELRLMPRLIRSGTIPASRELRAGAEFAWLTGSISWQAEYHQAFVYDGTEGLGSASPRGAYAQVGCFLTGEQQVFDPRRARFRRVAPARALFDGGPGAWELKARVSWLDLGRRFDPGEQLLDVTAGVNWHWDTMTRVVADLVWGDVEDTGSFVALGLRLQFSF